MARCRNIIVETALMLSLVAVHQQDWWPTRGIKYFINETNTREEKK
jgi:hypothetical protein